MNTVSLAEQIEALRTRLNDLVEDTDSLVDPGIVQLSQELDCLIVNYQIVMEC